MGKNSIFKQVGALHLRKHKYVLNYHKYFDCEAAQLVPVAFEECVPGDIVRIGNEALIRMQPLVKPIFGKLTYHTYSFFIPTAIMFGEYKTDGDGNHYWDPNRKLFELFLSRGVDGRDMSVSLPYWTPTHTKVRNDAYYEWTVGEGDDAVTYSKGEVYDNGVGSLWDYFGLPIDTIPTVTVKDENGNSSTMSAVLNFPRIAYNLVYGEFFRDQNLMDFPDVQNSSIVRNKCWKKDLFTSALPWQQRGIQPALPVDLSGVLPVSFLQSVGTNENFHLASFESYGGIEPIGSNPSTKFRLRSASNASSGSAYDPYNSNSYMSGSVDASDIVSTTFNVSDLRAAFQVQKWLERSARSGTRMKEILLAHFGTAPADEVLQRPYFIGHTSAPIFISEVLQTSETTETSDQGNLSGHGISASRNYAGSYHAKEFGYILTLACIVPETSYSQGIDKKFSKFSRWDYFWPETMFLSEDTVRQMEIYADPNNDPDENANIFGYQSRFYDLRSRQNVFCGSFRDDLDYWHMGREFDDAPILNESFVKMVPTKRIFNSMEKAGFLVDHFNVHTWYRPLPYSIEPGLIDHM